MKYMLVLPFAFAFYSLPAQQVISIGGGQAVKSKITGLANGQAVPDFTFGKIMNGQQQTISLAALKGKVVILEFWATWCGPCIPAMEHLDKLKNKFPGIMEVIAVSDETESRILRFIHNKPSSVWFYSDTLHRLLNYFPFHAIPHSVIIDPAGKLVAATSPGEITEIVIEKILAGKEVFLKEKKDGTEGFDWMKDYFPKPAGFNDFSFEVQPAIPGGFPISQNWSGLPVNDWNGRRITLLNNPVSLIYRIAFNKTPATTFYEGVTEKDFDYRSTPNLYCIDVIVPKEKKNELYTYLQQQVLLLNLPYKCRLEKRKMECVVITSTDPSKLEPFRSVANSPLSSPAPTIIRATSYEKQYVPLDDLLLHFENFGVIKKPFINATGIKGNFDLLFQFDAEDPNSFKRELAKFGLKGELKESDAEVLVIYRDHTPSTNQ